MAANVVSFDEDDDGVLGVFSKGSTKLFEMDKVFTSASTQQQVIFFFLMPVDVIFDESDVTTNVQALIFK